MGLDLAICFDDYCSKIQVSKITNYKLTLIVNEYPQKKSQSTEELRPKMNLTHTNKPIRIKFYLLIVSVEPETEVLYTSKGWPAGPCTTLPAVSKIEL